MNISVIIPVYNVEKYVERCILSIMSQTGPIQRVWNVLLSMIVRLITV